jgi:transcription initiation factor TFIIA large subunit
MSAAQHDGGSDDPMADWKAAVAARRAFSDQERTQADHSLRDYLQSSIAVEDGSLMLPMSQQARKAKKQRKFAAMTTTDTTAATPSGPSRFDGAGAEDNKDDVKKQVAEGEEEDEDAINSDLDDSDDGLENDDDDEDGPMGETILCTYDKVQRVKNKAGKVCFICHCWVSFSVAD